MTANVMFDIHIPSDDIFLAEIHCGDIPFSDIYVLCQFHLYLHPFINKIFVHKVHIDWKFCHIYQLSCYGVYFGDPRFIGLVRFITSKFFYTNWPITSLNAYGSKSPEGKA